jgi:hypothetical protein
MAEKTAGRATAALAFPAFSLGETEVVSWLLSEPGSSQTAGPRNLDLRTVLAHEVPRRQM